jgi:hypothetical protein
MDDSCAVLCLKVLSGRFKRQTEMADVLEMGMTPVCNVCSIIDWLNFDAEVCTSVYVSEG